MTSIAIIIIPTIGGICIFRIIIANHEQTIRETFRFTYIRSGEDDALLNAISKYGKHTIHAQMSFLSIVHLLIKSF